MFRLIKFTVKTLITIKLMALAFAAGMGVAYALQLRVQYQTWGLLKDGDDLSLAGDDLVPEADFVETRAIEIEAGAAEVWPWLMQLGYGRGGWYSYPLLDRPWSPGGAMGSSADPIIEEHRELAVGDLVQTQPEGGFVVRVVEPSEALVLYLDDSLTREQIEEMVADSSEEATDAVAEMELPPYAVSWAFVLEDAPGGRTRLIERIRVRVESLNDSQRKMMPAAGIGVFALMRSQLQGIKSRVETTADTGG